MQWEFHFRMKRWRAQVPQCIHGATLVHFDAQGRVTRHRDYWDPAEELYEKLPVLGGSDALAAQGWRGTPAASSSLFTP